MNQQQNTQQELIEIFREGIIKENPEMEFQPDLLNTQIRFLMERANNFEHENITESEISDKAFSVGLHDNNLVNRKISNCYDFSKQ